MALRDDRAAASMDRPSQVINTPANWWTRHWYEFTPNPADDEAIALLGKTHIIGKEK